MAIQLVSFCHCVYVEKLFQTMLVYHHCLFGTRYDFLCANYTAFDQTLFNCNFVSNVDCENSKKFWHRNDELYIEKSTTTTAPPAYNFYTPPPQGVALTPSSLSPGQSPPLPPVEHPIPRRSAASRGRPYARPRPQYDYYEDDYEEIPRPKARKRRPRPRPVYYDDYEDYEDDRPPRRGGRRRPYRRDRLMRRSKDRRKYEYDDVDYRYDYDDVILGKSQKDKRRKLIDDYEYEDDRRDRYERRRPQNRRSDKPFKKSDKRHSDDDYDYEEDARYTRRKPKDEVDRRRALNEKSEENKKVPRLGKRRPPSEDFEDDLQRADNSRTNERSRKSNFNKPSDDGRPIIKPVSGTIYDRPRVAPRINLPVPKNAAEKYAYKPIGSPATSTPKVRKEEEYEDEEEPSTKSSKSDRKNGSTSSLRFKEADYSEAPLRSNNRPKLELNKGQQSSTVPPSSSDKTNQTSEEYEYDYEDEEPVSVKEKSSSTTTTESIADHPMPIIRKFKRPFLPSRGGNPLSARNLQPVGAKVSSRNETQGVTSKDDTNATTTASPVSNDNEEIQEVRPDLKPVPVRAKSPISSKLAGEVTSSKKISKEEDKTGPIRIKVPIRVVPPITEQDKSQNQNGHGYKLDTATERPKLTETDILNGNYDVTLNEAISPIIPKLPIRSFGGFPDYAYKRIQRPTKYVILDPVVSGGSAYYVK